MKKKKDFIKKFTQIEMDTRLLTRIRKVTNELLSNCGYSNVNETQQLETFEKKGVAEWEINIIQNAWILKRAIAKKLFNDLELLIKEYGGVYINENNNTK